MVEEGRPGERTGGPARHPEDDERVEKRVLVVGHDEDGSGRDRGPANLDAVEDRDRPPGKIRHRTGIPRIPRHAPPGPRAT